MVTYSVGGTTRADEVTLIVEKGSWKVSTWSRPDGTPWIHPFLMAAPADGRRDADERGPFSSQCRGGTGVTPSHLGPAPAARVRTAASRPSQQAPAARRLPAAGGRSAPG